MKRIKQAFIFWLARRLPACEDTTTMVSVSMDEKLPLWARIRLRLHLYICIWCRRYLDQLLFIRKTMRENSPAGIYPDSSALSNEARERIRRRLTP